MRAKLTFTLFSAAVAVGLALTLGSSKQQAVYPYSGWLTEPYTIHSAVGASFEAPTENL